MLRQGASNTEPGAHATEAPRPPLATQFNGGLRCYTQGPWTRRRISEKTALGMFDDCSTACPVRRPCSRPLMEPDPLGATEWPRARSMGLRNTGGLSVARAIGWLSQKATVSDGIQEQEDEPCIVCELLVSEANGALCSGLRLH
uniref:Uncharacterized protein n=1 Tax=Eutreptiella gymnastica TaxID=73025 RepID=A0A7S4CUM3_9EUGL